MLTIRNYCKLIFSDHVQMAMLTPDGAVPSLEKVAITNASFAGRPFELKKKEEEEDDDEQSVFLQFSENHCN